MCGIVAYIGSKSASPILIEGLKRLEYRGYDSAGIALFNNNIETFKSKGRVRILQDLLHNENPSCSNLGIAHTRWATHGAPSDKNAHPHLGNKSNQKPIAIVHNGIIENYSSLKIWLEKRDHVFLSETDTEVLAHLIGEFYDGDLEFAVQKALRKVEGAYAIAAISEKEPGVLVVARKGSPLLVGVADSEYIVASDSSAIVAHTTKAVELEDSTVVRLTKDGFRTTNLQNIELNPEIRELEFDLEQIELGSFDHFMLKEIFEQPQVLERSMQGRVDLDRKQIVLGGLTDYMQELVKAKRIILLGQGTALHAAMIGEYLFEDLAKIPAEVEYASEFRYRNPIIEEGTVVIAVSQSGETADTLAAVQEAKNHGALTFGAVNVVGSSIPRMTDGGVYLRVGPEIGVASTKAFLGQCLALTMMALSIGRRRYLSSMLHEQLLEDMSLLPSHIITILSKSEQIKEITERAIDRDNWLFLGRGYNYPVAMEGALKLKEISYIHAEGMPAAEMKHGPIALIDEGMPAVFVATRNSQYKKVLSNIEEVRSRGGKVIAVCTEGDKEIGNHVDEIIEVPAISEPLEPILTAVPLQLIAYHAAVLRQKDVDKPRNLAKSVTVE